MNPSDELRGDRAPIEFQMDSSTSATLHRTSPRSAEVRESRDPGRVTTFVIAVLIAVGFFAFVWFMMQGAGMQKSQRERARNAAETAESGPR